MSTETFESATETFLSGLTYYGELDAATLHALRTAAIKLDEDFKVTLLTEYRRQLEAIKAIGQVGGDDGIDPLLMP